jgi:hypothetical protein
LLPASILHFQSPACQHFIFLYTFFLEIRIIDQNAQTVVKQYIFLEKLRKTMDKSITTVSCRWRITSGALEYKAGAVTMTLQLSVREHSGGPEENHEKSQSKQAL